MVNVFLLARCLPNLPRGPVFHVPSAPRFQRAEIPVRRSASAPKFQAPRFQLLTALGGGGSAEIPVSIFSITKIWSTSSALDPRRLEFRRLALRRL